MRYFLGSNVASNHLEASPAKSFKDLVDRHLNALAPIGLTQAEFRAMPKPERDQKKRVPYLVPASFPTSPATRRYENATVCNLIFLDIDESNHAQPYVSSPETLAEQLAPYNFAAYHTASSTPEKPRIRIVVEADGIAKEDYRDAVRTIAAKIGLPFVNKESMVAHQPMFLPSLFSDQDPLTTHPVFKVVTQRRAMLPSDIEQVELGDAPRHRSELAPGPADELSFLRAPLPEITLEMAESALSAISPDVHYGEWLEMAAALKHQFSHVCHDDAFDLFDRWSSQGSSYPGLGGRDGTEAKWDSLRASPVGRVPKTIRTLLSRAKEAGWGRADEAKEVCYQSVCDWATHDATSGDIFAKGVARIAALPLLGCAEEASLLNFLIKAADSRFAMKSPLASLRKDLESYKQKAGKVEVSTEQDIPPWAKGFCYIISRNSFYQASTRKEMPPEQLNNAYSRYLMSDDAKEEPGSAFKPFCLPQHYLLNKVECQTVDDTIYDPVRANQIFIEDGGRSYVNLFDESSYPKAEAEGSEEAGEHFLHHLSVLIKEPEYRRIIMDFMAYQVQFPGRKIRWAIVLQGQSGCGKTLVAKALEMMLGEGNVRMVDTTAIKGSYNEWAVGAQVVVIEEIRVQGGNKFDVMNSLKPLVTNDRVAINEKFENTKTKHNCTNYLALTNFHDSIAITLGERRYCIIKSALQTEEQVKALGDDYFPALVKMINSSGAQLRYFFETWPISKDFKPNGHAPWTKYLDQVLHDSACDVTAAVRRYVEEGENPLIQRDLISSAMLKSMLAIDGIPCSDKKLGGVLHQENYTEVGRVQLAPGRREYFWRKVGLLNGSTDVPAVARERAFHFNEENTCDI